MSRAVVLTGASSFVGYHLAVAFADAGWRVNAIHSRSIAAYDDVRAERLKLVRERARLIEADLGDPTAAQTIVDAVSPTLWIQHAGFADNYASPDYQLGAAHAVNVLALNPIYRTLAGGGCGVIITGSSMEYAASDDANKEDDPCWPEFPYGLSKLAETLYARQLAIRYVVPTRVARLYIPFGQYDNPRKLLPSVIAALGASKPIDLSDCVQRRDFIAVEDVAAGYVRLGDDLPRTLFDIFNLCRGEAVQLRDLLLGFAGTLGADPSLLRFGALAMRPGEPNISFGDAGKARELLGWSARPISIGHARIN
jgi:nucleoside-diphosphate-sugar epimerase